MTVNKKKIEILLAKQGLTKTDCAKKCNISRQSISTIICRGTCEPRTAGKLAEGLGVPVEEIAEGGVTMQDTICKIPVVGRMVKDPDGTYHLDKAGSTWADIPADAIARFLVDRCGADAVFRGMEGAG